MRRARLNPCKIKKILITHWHGDHIFGIPGLLHTLSLSGYNNTLEIYGPRGTKEFVREIMGNFGGRFPILVNEITRKGKFFETEDFYLEAELMEHGAPTNAYVFVKKGRIRIDKNKLKKSKLPLGPLLANLKKGKDISYKGKKYMAKNLTYSEGDKKISFVLDTRLNSRIVPFVRNSDLLICESSFGSEMEQRAREYFHLTSKQAAEIAKKSQSKKLILTHLSQRYEKNPEKILNESKKIFKNSILVKDLDVIKI